MPSHDFSFPVGYHRLHPDASLNFQLNRFWNWVGEEKMLEELREAAPRIHSYDDWTRELLALSEIAHGQGRALAGAYHARAAEFFMLAGDPRRAPTRRRFVETVLHEHDVPPSCHHRVPYEGKTLSAYRFTPGAPRGTIVVFGGFDSYIEEWMPFLLGLEREGLDVVAFDGPGQGAALEDGIPMTVAWGKPVRAVLDHFQLSDVTLLGFSLGGCLVMHGAADEPRVARVVADDVLTDFMEVNCRSVSGASRMLLQHADRLPDAVVNRALQAARKRSFVADWGIGQGMRVLGVDTPARYLAGVRAFRTAEVSPRIRQDVLLIAGSQDHYVPVKQLGDQLCTLTNARSVAARLFTERESAQNHCCIGNVGLCLRVIVDWLDAVGGRRSAGERKDAVRFLGSGRPPAAA